MVTENRPGDALQSRWQLASLLKLRHSPAARRAFTASSWSVGGYGASLALRLVSRLVLAKLLTDASPMGNVAVVVTITSGLEMISDLGIGMNIVQHPRGSDESFLSTAFSIQLLRAVVLWALAAAIAFPIASIYHDPQLGPLLLFASSAVLIRGLMNPRLFSLNRSLELRWPTILTAGSEFVAFGVTVAWAFVHASAWSLVGGTVAGALLYSGCSHLIGARIRPRWDPQLASQIIRFGGWTLVSSGTWFLASRGENLMLKGSIPDIDFGCFAFASMIVTTPAGAITQLGSNVFFPMMSSLVRTDPAGARKHYVRGKLAFTGVAAVTACGFVLLGPMAVGLLHLNSSYRSLGWMVQLLGVRAAQEIYTAPAANIILASGGLRYCAGANVVRLIVLAGGLALAIPAFGMGGAMWVLVGASAVSYFALLPGLYRFMPGVLRVESATLIVLLGIVGMGALAMLART